MVYELKGSYDLIVSKNWIMANSYVIDHSNNTMHLLGRDWLSLQKGLPEMVPVKKILCLRAY
jgi:hypothetical protein